MDPAQYYTQGSSSYSDQYQDNGGNNQQLVQVDSNAVSGYLRALYQNTTHQVSAPTNEPAFYEKARQEALEAKHKTEQMLLVIQQQAEIAAIRQTILPSAASAQISMNAAPLHPQMYYQGTSNALVHQDPGWAGAMPEQWSYAQQGSSHQTHHTRSAHISPQVEMSELSFAQQYGQTSQAGAQDRLLVSYQPQSQQQYSNMQSAQYTQSQSQPAPVSQTWATTQVHQHHHLHSQPQSHYRVAGRHPLQPDQQSSQTGSSQLNQAQKGRDQVATAQKQLQHLHMLEQQHQRPQTEPHPPATVLHQPDVPQQPLVNRQQAPPQQPIRVRPAVAQGALAITDTSGASSDQTNVTQPTQSNPPPTGHVTLSSTPVGPPLASLPNEPKAFNTVTEVPATPTQARSPVKVPRSTRQLTLQDLRSVRRHSNQASMNQKISGLGIKPQANVVKGTHTGGGGTQRIDQDASSSRGVEAQRGSFKPGNTSENISEVSWPRDTPPNASSQNPKHGDEIMSSYPSSNTVAPSTQPPHHTSAGIPGPALATSATPALAGVLPNPKTLPGPASFAAISTPGTFVPALNNIPPSSASAMPISSPVDQRGMASAGARSKANVNAQTSAGPSTSTAPLKLMLERLHQHGIDCVDVVRRAAESAGAPTDLLKQPSPGMGGGSTPVIPLFAPNQPLEIWTQGLKVSRTQGEMIVKQIWSIARDRIRDAGLNMASIMMPHAGSAGETVHQTDENPSGSGANTPVSNTVPLAGTSGAVVEAVNSVLIPQPVVSGANLQAPLQTQTTRAPQASSVPVSKPHYRPPPQNIISQSAAVGQLSSRGSLQTHHNQLTPTEAPRPPSAQQQSFHPHYTAQQNLPHPIQHAYQSHPMYNRPEMQAYTPSHLGTRIPPVRPLAPAPSMSKTSKSVKPIKGGGTPALDFLRSLGVTDLDGRPLGDGSSDAGSDSGIGKGKGKEKAGFRVDSPIPGPIDVEPPSVDRPSPSIDTGEESLLQTTRSLSAAVAPTVDKENHVPVAAVSEPTRPITPPSPVLAPTIAVLQELRSPTTTASPLPEPLLENIPVVEPEVMPEPVIQAPQPLAASVVPAVLAQVPAPASSPPPIQAPPSISVPVPAPIPALASPPERIATASPAPMSSVTPVDAPTVDTTPADEPMPQAPSTPKSPTTMADRTPASVDPALVDEPMSRARHTPNSPAIVSTIIREETPAVVSSPAPAPEASTLGVAPTSQLAPAEYMPLKRKRDSTGAAPDRIPIPTVGPTQDSWTIQYARTANSLSDAKKARKAKFGDTPSQSVSSSASMASGSRLAAKPKPRPLFRPETPPSEEEVNVDIDDEGDAPQPAQARAAQQRPGGKRRMIMEVVIPLRKGAKAKTVAVPRSTIQSMIDLTADDESEEESEDNGEEYENEDEQEQEPDLRMLRRRLRERICQWRGCVGPAILASTELLGVHLNKRHPPTKDVSGYFACGWAQCRMQFMRRKNLWEHMSQEHIVQPLWCPYQGCSRSTLDRYQLNIHINRKHRNKPDHELRPLARPEECTLEALTLRPSAFPPGVPYFRIMEMALRYNIVPASISAHRHAQIGPKILEKISSAMATSPVRTTTPYASTSAAGGTMPVFESPVPVRAHVRLSTLPPDVLDEENLERAVAEDDDDEVQMVDLGPSSSPARSHITVHSDDETPEREIRAPRGRGRGSTTTVRGLRQARGRGRGRGRGVGSGGRRGNTSVFGGNVERQPAVRASASTSTSTSTPSTSKAPGQVRLQMIVELPNTKRT